jgi:hypothetical protein
MGLLDEAIREHLELKRRRGADPSEVARAQREALDPISAPAEQVEGLEDSAEDPLDEDLPTQEHALDVDAVEPPDGPGAESHAEMAPSAVSSATTPARSREPEETAELDMSTVLDDDPTAPGRPAAAHSDDAPETPPAAEPVQLEHGPSEGTAGS